MKALLGKILNTKEYQKTNGSKRSPHWATVRKEFLEKNPTCAVCGGTEKLEVHHRVPFHTNPEKELDPTNLIALCEANKWLSCHLAIGHAGSYKTYNPDVEATAKLMSEMLKKKKVNTAD